MLLQPELQAIELPVADLRFSETLFRQNARPAKLTMTFLPDGCVELQLLLERQPFGLAADGSFGAAVPPGYLKLEPARLLGDRNVAVDPADGFPRYRLRTLPMQLPGGGMQPGTAVNTLTQEVEEFAEGQDWPAFLEAKPGVYMLQDRYFGVMCSRENVNIFDLLLAYAQQADAAPSLFAVQ
jgi:hypothetical protein